MKTNILFASLALLLIVGVASTTLNNNAFACYSSKETNPCYKVGTHILIAKFKVEKSDCFDEIYAAARVDGHPEILLNKQTYKNNDKPDAGPSTDHGTFKWMFTGSKITNAEKSDPNSDGMRVYMEIWGVNDNKIETKTKYVHNFDPKIKEWDLEKVLKDGRFHLYAQPTLCL